MKTGAIVYVVGTDKTDKDFDLKKAVENLGIKADRIEVVSTTSGHFDVMDAWWFLTIKGMKKVVCMLAEVVDDSRIALMGRELRLCG